LQDTTIEFLAALGNGWGIEQLAIVAVHIAAATWNKPKRKFQTSGVPVKFLKTHQMDTAETDETGFWRFCHYATGELP
jgi:hypothetical protein